MRGVCGKCVRNVWHGRYTHRPQTKMLEFLVAMLAGLPHLKDISHGAHPLDQDAAVARFGPSVLWQRAAFEPLGGGRSP